MSVRARTIVLTPAGYVLTDLIRAGVVSVDDEPPKRGVPQPQVGRCPVCKHSMWPTPSGLVRAHSRDGRECPGTGRQVAR